MLARDLAYIVMSSLQNLKFFAKIFIVILKIIVYSIPRDDTQAELAQRQKYYLGIGIHNEIKCIKYHIKKKLISYRYQGLRRRQITQTM